MGNLDPIILGFLGFLILLVAYLLYSTFFTVSQQSVSIVERLGKFVHIAQAGLNLKIPLIDSIAGRLSLRVLQLDVPVESKTRDNVFIKLGISVQYKVKFDSVYDAFYKLSNPELQITSFIFDVVRAEVPKMILDDVFEKKDSIAVAIKTELSDQMGDFGYDIIKALVTDIDPDPKVKTAMNEINEQQRLRMAAEQKGEANKIIRVKKAEGDAESLRLQGQGISDQRQAIVKGLKDSICDFQESVKGTSASDVMSLVLVTQYYDALKEIGANNKSTTLLLPSIPNDSETFSHILQKNILSANIASKGIQEES